MLYLTGDLHGEGEELLQRARALGAGDYLLVCGDFGMVWRGTRREALRLDWLNARLRCTVLFVDGNHENFDLLERFPISVWQGGLVHRIRPRLVHLMRGQVFEVAGRTVFTMGGASSHDMPDGVLDPRDPDFAARRRALDARGGRYRIRRQSWWPQELPRPRELAMGLRSLLRQDWRVDLIVTHCLPSSVQQLAGGGFYPPDRLTDYLETVRRRCEFGRWYCGHYHHERLYLGQYQVLYHSVLPAQSRFDRQGGSR